MSGSIIVMLVLANILLNLFTALNAQDGDDLSSRVLYGTRASIKDYPYFAALANCGAAILSDRWLVTAAHCVAYPGLTSGPVWVGAEQLKYSKQYQYDKAIIYPLYKTVSSYRIPIYDLALLRLSKPLVFNEAVKPLKLPEEKYQLNTIYEFAGKGKDESGVVSQFLMKANVQTLNAAECQSYISFMDIMTVYPFMDQIRKVTICTVRTEDLPGLCHGDSGSPLVRNNTLVGVASYINNAKCKQARLAFFTEVSPFVDWIKTVTGIK